MPHLGRLIRQSVIGAAGELLRHRWRTVLICQGILWAVALMVAPASILQGSRQAAVDRARELGTDLIQVEVEPGTSSPLAVEDLEQLRSSLADDFPETTVSGQTVHGAIIEGKNSVRGWIVATDPEQIAARSLQLISGRWFERGANPPEVVIEEPLALQLFNFVDGRDDFAGKELWIERGRFDSWLAGIGAEV
ncbi:MAG: ABC transporter permease, partial [Planctomycetota bacterium]